jgi:hypothetical protein
MSYTPPAGSFCPVPTFPIFIVPFLLFSTKSIPMISFDLTINIFTLILIAGASALAGFLARQRQLARKQRRIVQAERDMVQAHAELLEMQKEYCEMETRMREFSIPVISMNQASKEEVLKNEQMPDRKGQKDRTNRTA